MHKVDLRYLMADEKLTTVCGSRVFCCIFTDIARIDRRIQLAVRFRSTGAVVTARQSYSWHSGHIFYDIVGLGWQVYNYLSSTSSGVASYISRAKGKCAYGNSGTTLLWPSSPALAKIFEQANHVGSFFRGLQATSYASSASRSLVLIGFN